MKEALSDRNLLRLLDYLLESEGGITANVRWLDGPYQTYFTLAILLLMVSLTLLLRIRANPIDGDTDEEWRGENSDQSAGKQKEHE